MEELSEILITVVKNHYLVQLEFPDGNPVQLPKENLISIGDYFRTLCDNEIEHQYVAINEYTYSQNIILLFSLHQNPTICFKQMVLCNKQRGFKGK